MDTLAILQRLGSGHLLEELTEALVTTAEEVVATGSPGTVTLTLKVSNRGIGELLVIVEEKLARKAPEKPARGAIFYAVAGDLYREDPRQTKLEFRSLDSRTGEIRDLDDDSDIREAH